jgi:hypothetical protein
VNNHFATSGSLDSCSRCADLAVHDGPISALLNGIVLEDALYSTQTFFSPGFDAETASMKPQQETVAGVSRFQNSPPKKIPCKSHPRYPMRGVIPNLSVTVPVSEDYRFAFSVVKCRNSRRTPSKRTLLIRNISKPTGPFHVENAQLATGQRPVASCRPRSSGKLRSRTRLNNSPLKRERKRVSSKLPRDEQSKVVWKTSLRCPWRILIPIVHESTPQRFPMARLRSVAGKSCAQCASVWSSRCAMLPRFGPQ